ncbi:MAG TPA: peptidylprolyl isomerase, partial [Pyrinomonadaceae bacterium]|nr:peptidylprolyl isomerase [Pyrinomonadaceae bacterium]
TPLQRILAAEDERRWDESDLGALLSDKSAAVRRRAALAAGRIGDAGAVFRLAALLRADRDEGVRAMAAFALGEIESPSAAPLLLDALKLSKSVAVRARVVEALGKIAAALPQGDEERRKTLGDAILDALSAEGMTGRPNKNFVLLGLTAALRSRHERAPKIVAAFLQHPDARVRADALNTLARLRAKESLEKIRAMLSADADAVVRANSARVLGAAEDAASFDALAARVTSDTDSRVRVSSVRALAQLGDPRAAAPLLTRAEAIFPAYRVAKTGRDAHPPETAELLEIATALGRVLTNRADERALSWLRLFREAEGRAAPEVEVALARVAPAQYLREPPFPSLTSREAAGGAALTWQSVSALAQGLAEIAALTSATGGNSFISLQADAQIILRALLEDSRTPAKALPDVMRALAAYKPGDLAALVRVRLAAEDVLVRATAADILAETAPAPETTRALASALPRALTDELNDAALSILAALAHQKTSEANEALKTALGVPDHLVRRRAAALLREAGATGPATTTATNGTQVETVATQFRAPDYARALSRAGKSVRARVSTDKGDFIIELLPSEAPLTVDNFVTLARKGYFNNLTFHRVVPNFVVQGGDPRGDGSGGPGYQIRCEVNEVPYERGAVGMALSGKDTGGSQWFVTHSPQPHLDGGYTVFGRVVEGMDVIDRVARGDRIRTVVITEGAQRRPAARGRRASD